MSGETQTPTASDCEILISRLIDAPGELVWQVWTEAKHLINWWAPDGFSSTIHKMEVRPGGLWHFVMQGPDGVDYPNKVVYSQVQAPERLVFEHRSADTSSPSHTNSVSFQAVDGKTQVTMVARFASPEILQEMLNLGVDDAGRQTLGRLAYYLHKIQTV